jgi:hypothetical protein
MSGPVELDALGSARPAGALLRVRRSLHWAAGTLAFGSVAVPRPCDAPGHAPTDLLRQGVRHLLLALPITVITSPAVQHLEFKGQEMVVAVFEVMQADPARLLPREELAKYDAVGGDLRVICDVVAAMTDTHLLKTYERLFSPRMGSVFDRL